MQRNPSYAGEQSYKKYPPPSQSGYPYQDIDINDPTYYGGEEGGSKGRLGGGRYGSTEMGGAGGTRTKYRSPPDGLQPTNDFEYHQQFPGRVLVFVLGM